MGHKLIRVKCMFLVNSRLDPVSSEDFDQCTKVDKLKMSAGVSVLRRYLSKTAAGGRLDTMRTNIQFSNDRRHLAVGALVLRRSRI